MKRTLSLAFTMSLLIVGFSFAQQQPKPPQPQPKPEFAMTLPEGAKAIKDIEYANVNGKSLKLDLYLPKGEMKAGKPKLLVWIHGGGWRGGNKESVPMLWLVGKGYAVASISYRLSDVAVFPAAIHDCKGAIRWLRAHEEEYRYDADNIGVGGGSAGGHLVSMLGTTGGETELEGETADHKNRSSRVQAVLNYFGPCDFPNLEAQKHPEFTTSLVALFIASPISQNKKLAEQASPLYHVTKDDAPHLIIQGTKDPLIHVEQVKVLHDAYIKAGLESKLEIIEGGGHGGPQFWDEPRRKMIEEFFDKHIKHGPNRKEKEKK